MIILRRVVGSSMKPALFEGDIVVARTRKKPQVGDIVVAKHENREIIKRVEKVTGKKYFLVGDNKHASTDSRKYGAVPKADIKAVAVFAFGTSSLTKRRKLMIATFLTLFCLAVIGFGAFGGYKTMAKASIQSQKSVVIAPKPPEPTPLVPSYPISEVRKDILYCNDQKLDIYYPRKATSVTAPVVIYMHGGGWENNDKASEVAMLDVLEPLRDEGYAIVSIDYRKLPEFSYPAPVQDALCSVRYLRTEQKTLGIDPNKIALFGFSAGGHLAAMVGTLDSNNKFSEGQAFQDQSSRVNAVVTQAGLLDFENGLRDNNVLRIRYFLKGANWHDSAPISYVSSDDPPFLLVHGMQDQYVSPEQDTLFAKKLTENGVSNEVLHIENAEHGLGEVGGKMNMTRDQVSEKIRLFIKQKLQ